MNRTRTPCAAVVICLRISIAVILSSPAAWGQSGSIELRITPPVVGHPDREMYERFLERNPDVSFVPAGGVGLDGLAGQASFFMAMAGGTAADVFYAPLEQLQTYYEQNCLYPIEELAPAGDPLLDSILDVVKPVVIQNGHIIGMPIFYNVHGFVWRKDLFRKAGLPLRGPRDWDELFQFALAIHDPENGVIGYPVFGEGWIFSHYLWQAGGDYITYGWLDPKTHQFNPLPGPNAPYPNGAKLTIRSRFHEKPGQMAVNYYRRILYCQWARDAAGNKMLFRDVDIETGRFITHSQVTSQATGTVYRVIGDDRTVSDGRHTSNLYTGVGVTFTAPERLDLFERIKRGRVGMWIGLGSGAGMFSRYLNPAVTGISAMPIGPSGRPVTIINAGCWCVNSQLDPGKRDAVWRFIKFMTGPEAIRIKVRHMVQDGLASFVRPKYLELAGYGHYVSDVPKDWVAANRDLEKIARPVPNAPGHRMAEALIGETLMRLQDHPELNVAAELRRTAEQTDLIYAGAMGETEAQSRSRTTRTIAAIVVVLLAAAFAYGIYRLIHQFYADHKVKTATSISHHAGQVRGWRVHVAAWAFMLPALLTIFVFSYVPLARGSYMALMDYKILGESRFVGLENFIGVLLSRNFYWSLFVTIEFTFITLAIGFVAPIVVALLLDEVPRGKYLFRTIFYIPAVSSGLVILMLWKEFYDPDTNGALNQFFGLLGLGPYSYLKDPRLALLCVVIPSVWAGAGPGSILYLAALKVVPNELHEAASLDGASWYHRIRYVVIPTLAPLILINLIGAFIGAMQGSGNILVMTGGGPDRATHVLDMEIFFNAYVFLKFGYATALSWILGSILIGFAVLQMRMLRRVEFRSTGAN